MPASAESPLKTVRLSEILKFYPEDFLRRSPGLIAYVTNTCPRKFRKTAR